MDEPSVWDYVKSKLTFWRKSSLHLPPPPQSEKSDEVTFSDVGDKSIQSSAASEDLVPWLRGEPEVIPASLEMGLEPEIKTDTAEIPVLIKGSFPWLTLIALLVAFFAQRSLEPGTGDRVWKPGMILYGFVAVLLILAFVRKEWVLPSPQKNEDTSILAIRINREALFLAIPFALLSFLAFGGGMFTPLNLVLWLITIFLFIKTFWIKQPLPVSWIKRSWFKIKQRQWTFRINRWVLLIFVVAAIAIFYRYFRIMQVPSDMTSDHAEKLLDVFDVLHGKPGVYFPRNAGREFIQFYLTAGIILLIKTGYSYLSLKIGTIFIGLITLPFLYLLGKELGNKRVGLAAAFFGGIAYWPNVISRVGLRLPLYPFFVAPVLYFLFRGIRRRKVNDFILSGVFLGFGINGYTSVRILPFVVVAAVIIYLLHRQSRAARKQTIIALVILAVVAIVFIIPLGRYAVDHPEIVLFRTLTRLGTEERAYPQPPLQIFISNLWNSVISPFWSDGSAWVMSVPSRPALDIIQAALFFMGCVMLLIRYVRHRNWIDLFLLVSIPMLMLPSILSLAFPAENPSPSRSGGAIIPIMLIIAIAFDGILTSVKTRLPGRQGLATAGVIGALLVSVSLVQNYDLVFNQFATVYTQSGWNTAEMGQLVADFINLYKAPDSAWVVGFPYWVDTRLVAFNAGLPYKDLAIWPDGQMPDSPLHLSGTQSDKHAKLFLINAQDTVSVGQLKTLYPTGFWYLQSSIEGASKDFIVFMVPPAAGAE